MRSPMKRSLLGLATLSLFVLLAPPARAEDVVTLRFALPGATESSPNWKGMLGPWVKQIEDASDGTLKFQPFFGSTIANFGNVYDRVIGGAIDVGFGVQGAVGGKFQGSSVVELPSDIRAPEGAPA